MLKFIFRGILSLMVYLYWTTGGRLVGKVQGLPVLLLTTTGRKSGKLRTVPLSFTFDRLEHHFTFPMPAQPPAISAEAEGSTSITLLRYDQQRANEAYLLFYGQLARHNDTWSCTPTRVALRKFERRGA